MNYLVVGAGNASRPVARLLNYLGHKVIITDLKEMSEFKPIYKTWLHKMEDEGIILNTLRLKLLPNRQKHHLFGT